MNGGVKYNEITNQITISPLPEAQSLVTCRRETPGSNLDRHAGYPDEGLSWFFSVHPQKCHGGVVNWTTTALFYIFRNHNLLSSELSTYVVLWRC
jgi:hypothetical protein